MTTTRYDLAGAVMAYEAGAFNAHDTLELFGHLIATGDVWKLQGSYGRAAVALIVDGLIDADSGTIDWDRAEAVLDR